jgi:hypothetical protein
MENCAIPNNWLDFCSIKGGLQEFFQKKYQYPLNADHENEGKGSMNLFPFQRLTLKLTVI